MYRIEELITIASEKGASDVHLIAGLAEMQDRRSYHESDGGDSDP